MGLFFDILSSINNPDQKGSVSQIESVVNTINQLSATYRIDSSQMQSIISTVGGLIRPVLQQQKSLPGSNLESLMSQLIGAGDSAAAMQSLVPPQIQQQMVEAITQTTGLSADRIKAVLPTIIFSVISLLNMGASKPGIQGSGNPILNAFLDADQNNSVDLADVLKFGNRFLNPPQPQPV